MFCNCVFLRFCKGRGAVQYIFREDLEYLTNKYHLTDQPFDPFRRYLYHGVAYDPSTGMDDEEMDEALHALFAEIREQLHPIVKARAFAFVLDHMRIDVNPHDYFVGLYNWGRPARFIQEQWKEEAFAYHGEVVREIADLKESGASMLFPDFDHVIPDWDSLLRLGFPGLRERARRYRETREARGELTEQQTAFFDAIEIEFSAILRLLERLRAYALAHPSEKSATVAQSLQNLREGAPQTLADALQAIYIFFMLCEHVDNYQTRSIGNGLDQTLYPFYKNDRESGAFSEQELRMFLGYFLMQFSAIGNYWGHPFYLGGTDARGNTLVNEMSYLLLEIHEDLELYNPKIQIKVGDSTPTDFLNRVLDRIRKGSGSFVFCCEDGYIKAIMGYGATYEEARNFEISGCYESRVLHDESSAVGAYINALKPVLFALRDGRDETTGKQLGLRTGAPESFGSFAEFYRAFLAQWKHLICRSIRISSEVFDPALSVINPSVMYSATNERSLSRAADGYAYGCKYNNTAILNCGFASAVDALMAVKELVFDEKLVTLRQLETILSRNWEGEEVLRARALNSKHKYGNGDAETDRLARHASDFFTEHVNNVPNGRGGVHKAFLHSARMFVDQAARVGASPDGRRTGEEESKNASPAAGMDRNGVTALLRSVTSLELDRYPEAACVDLILHPTVTEGEKGLSVMKALLDTYRKRGGMALQFNVFRADTLRDAQKHPEKYRNLQVRVCGWSVLWRNLSQSEQNAYILRAENLQS